VSASQAWYSPASASRVTWRGETHTARRLDTNATTVSYIPAVTLKKNVTNVAIHSNASIRDLALIATVNKCLEITKRKSVVNKFDELTRGLAQSVTRRGAMKKFAVGITGIALAAFGLVNKAEAARGTSCGCVTKADCGGSSRCFNGACVPAWCDPSVNACCCQCKGQAGVTALPPCAQNYSSCVYVCGAMLCHK
jgi:hypothetical protein